MSELLKDYVRERKEGFINKHYEYNSLYIGWSASRRPAPQRSVEMGLSHVRSVICLSVSYHWMEVLSVCSPTKAEDVLRSWLQIKRIFRMFLMVKFSFCH